ncbi:MAG: ABC transporter permease [Treponema sp.]|nr:ABC transporter permease [Treponema sp.]
MPAIGIGFGVLALIVVMAVMNGFQMGSINSLLEISSYHIRVTPKENFNSEFFLQKIINNPQIKSITPFYEAQGLLVGKYGKQSASILRAVPNDVRKTDKNFTKEVSMYLGDFDLTLDNTIVLGWKLAENLGVRPGDMINILALSGGSDVDLFSDNRNFLVTGIFSCGYAEINNLFAFVSLESGKKHFGKDAQCIYGIKIEDKEKEIRTMQQLTKIDSNAKYETWKNFNKSFYSALRIEKNVLMLMVILIFLVVGINIFNGMRRMVFERREEICVLSALGARAKDIQRIFILRGFIIGFSGALPGLLFGLLLSVRIDAVFTIIAKLSYFSQYFFTMIFSPQNIIYVRENSVFLFYARIPARPFFSEAVFITLFGIFSSVFASWIASRKTLNLNIAEVLRDE